MPITLSESSLLVVTLLAITWVIGKYQQKLRQRGHILPPGPKPWPLIGNLLDFGQKDIWTLFYQWADHYGDITYVEALGNPMVVISSAQLAFELLERRSSIYSDRPVSALDEILGIDWAVPMMPYGKRWRDTRRCFHQQFNQLVTPKYRDAQTTGAHAFLRGIAQTGEVSRSAIRHMFASVIASVMYGMEIKDADNHYIQVAETVVAVLNESKMPGAYWVDYFPMLKHIPAWVPGAKAKQLGQRHFADVQKARNYGFDFAKSNAEANDCIVRDIINKIANDDSDEEARKIKEETARDATAVAYMAAIDSSIAFFSYLLTAIAAYPDVQTKVQHELDEVVGRNRLPDFDDRDSLPYLSAVLLECTRWRPVFPLSLPHKLTTDDYVEQYFLPKGTIIWPNVRRMLHDPQDYPEPERFNPDRFLKDGKLNPEVRDPSTLAFGFGRRNCPGRHFAKDNAYIVIATVLHVFNIRQKLDETGKAFDSSPTEGLVTFPKNLSCLLVPRFEEASKLILETM